MLVTRLIAFAITDNARDSLEAYAVYTVKYRATTRCRFNPAIYARASNWLSDFNFITYSSSFLPHCFNNVIWINNILRAKAGIFFFEYIMKEINFILEKSRVKLLTGITEKLRFMHVNYYQSSFNISVIYPNIILHRIIPANFY